MNTLENNAFFWQKLDTLYLSSKLVVDRPKGTCHYKYSNLVYPVDYGYLNDTTGSDQAPIDVFRGTQKSNLIQAVVVSADILKKDCEVKLLVGCTQEEEYAILEFLNQTEFQRPSWCAAARMCRIGPSTTDTHDLGSDSGIFFCMFRSGWEYSEAGRYRMRKLLLAVCLTLLCGCSSLGSADRGDLDMERALAHMAEEMREADVGVLMNAECEDTHVLQQLYDLQLQKGEYALIRGIRADVSQEAAIFKCNAENRSIIKEKVEARAAALSASDIPVQIGEKGDYLYIAIGADAVWMRNYLKGL